MAAGFFGREITRENTLGLAIINSKTQSRTELYNWDQWDNELIDRCTTDRIAVEEFRQLVRDLEADVVYLAHKRDAITGFQLTPAHLQKCAQFLRTHFNCTIPLLLVSSDFDMEMSEEIRQSEPPIADHIITLRCDPQRSCPTADYDFLNNLITALRIGQPFDQAVIYSRDAAQCIEPSFEYNPICVHTVEVEEE